MVDNSSVLSDVKDTFFTGDPAQLQQQITKYVDMFGITSEDLKNLSVAVLIGKMMASTSDKGVIGELQSLLTAANRVGVADQNAGTVLDAVKAVKS